MRLPADPNERRVSGYSVTVAISEPPRQPFLPRPVDRKPAIVAIAQIRDERELKPDYNRGGLLAEAGSHHVRFVSDRISTAGQPRADTVPGFSSWAADPTPVSRAATFAEAAANRTEADTIIASLASADHPASAHASFAADILNPGELDLWAAADAPEEATQSSARLITADPEAATVEIADITPSTLIIASDTSADLPFLAATSETRVTWAIEPTSSDRLDRVASTTLVSETVPKTPEHDRLGIAAVGSNWAEATQTLAVQGDRWILAQSTLSMADAGLRIRIDADQNEPSDLAHDLVETPPGAELADTLIAEVPLGFDPADAVFITALLPDWSAWDDAMRLAAMQERTLIRNAGTANYQPELPEKLSPTPVSARSLSDLFDRHNFRLGGATVVPALFIQRLPSDLSSVPQAADRKALFLRALLPFVVAANERITRQRERLLDLLPLLERGLPLGRDDRRFMDRLQEEFRVSRPDPEELLRRMDIVPPSLALAQAAEESGWGTSRPAREDNALFGQMVFHEGGMRLREFETLRETVEAYIRNLNTHRAYADFRQKRAQLRRANRPIDSHQLAGHIERYSERGVDYIATIRGLMTSNGLRNFDDARLSDIEFLVQAAAR